jgi:hypothetical protein
MKLDTTNLRRLAADLRELVDLHAGAYATVNHAAAALDRIADQEQAQAHLQRESDAHTRTMAERDHAEEIGTRLANAVGEHFRVEVGEHSSANDPRVMALAILGGEYITDSDADRRIKKLEQTKAEPAGHESGDQNQFDEPQSPAGAKAGVLTKAGDMASWLRRRLHNDLIHVPPKLAEQIADALDGTAINVGTIPESRASAETGVVPKTAPSGELPIVAWRVDWPAKHIASVGGTRWVGADDAERKDRLVKMGATAVALCIAEDARQHAAQFVRDADKVAKQAKTVHARIDSMCEAANTPDADYFDASTNMMMATRDLLETLGHPYQFAIDATLAKREVL